MPNDFEIEMNAFLPLRDVVFNTLRKAILTGELKPGERLMEIHLADRLGVSRTPIREAIRKLELEGLVVMVPRRGAEVAKITEKSMNDVLEIRRDLDALCAELACDRITDEELQALDVACKNFEQAVAGGDLKTIAKCDVELHDIILHATRNPRLEQMIKTLSEQMYRFRYEYIKDTTQHETLIAEHRMIYECLCRRDKESTATACRLHIDNQKNAIINQIRLDTNKGKNHE